MSGDGMEGLAVALAAVLILPISYAVVGYTAIKERHEWSPVFPDLQAQAGWSYLLGEHVAFVGIGAGYGSEFAADFRIGYVYRILHRK